MSILVELPERLYRPDVFATFDAAGTFSLGTARAMAWLSQLAYESDAGKIERVCALWDLRNPRVLAHDASRELPLQHTRGIVAEGHGAMVLAFAGTDPLVPANWFTDFDVTLTPAAMLAPDVAVTPGNIHRGFERGVAVVWDKIVAALAGRRERAVVLTGHSLGAALAVIAADRMLSDADAGVRATGVYGFGMPRAGDADFALRYNDTLGALTYRLWHGDDIVTTVPPSSLGFRHVGRLIRCPRAGRFSDAPPTADFSDEPPFARSLIAGLQQGLRDLFALRLQPTFRDDHLGRLSGLLAPPIADHLPDRYWHAFE